MIKRGKINKRINLKELLIYFIIFFVTLVFVWATPSISFISPTPSNRDVQTADSIYVNVSVSDANMSFIDFNRNLVAWWRFEEEELYTTPYNISDDFDDNELNTSIWFPIYNTKGGQCESYIDERDGELRMCLYDCTGQEHVRVTSHLNDYYFQGDFDIQVDFNITNGPATDVWYIHFSAMNIGPAQATSVQNPIGKPTEEFRLVYKYKGGSRVYTPEFREQGMDSLVDSTGMLFNSSDDYGKMRLTREGNNASVYYWNHTFDDWSILNSSVNAVSAEEDLAVYLWLATYTGIPDINMTFDNFIINNGTVVKHINITDNSTHRNTAIYGYNVTNVTGMIGDAYDFDGVSSYVKIDSVGLMKELAHRLCNGTTFSMWVNTTNTTARMSLFGEKNDDNDVLFANYINFNSAGAIQDGSIYIYMRDIDGTSGRYYGATDCDTGVNDGEWHHLAFVYNGTHPLIEVWVDGVNQTLVTPDADKFDRMDYMDYYMTIGALNTADVIQFYFDGSIDEFMIFNRTLSQEEIVALYNSSSFYHEYTDLENGTYSFTTYALNTSGSMTSTNRIVRVAGVDINYSDYNGVTTDLSPQVVNLSQVSNFTLESTNYGKIIFNGTIDFNSTSDLNTNVNISYNRIKLNSTALPNLNKPATLYLYNLTFSNPRILKDGSVCSSEICTKESYSEENTLKFNVTSFSVYSAEETPVTTTTMGGGGYPTFKISQENLKEGYEKSLRKNWKINFEFGYNTHTLKIDNIVNEIVTITLSSKPITFDLNVNEKKKINLDDDNFYDLEVYLKSISGNIIYSADLVIKLIHEEISKEEEEIKEEDELEEENMIELIEEELPIVEPSLSKNVIFVILGIIIILLILIKRKKISKYFW